jgi:hypothetical protein
MYCAFKGKPHTYVMLATAIVNVQNSFGQYVPCRALLDSAFQSHFVTERLVQRLKLAKLKKRTFIQGISDVNTEALYMVPLHIKFRYNDWHTTVDCVVLSSITPCYVGPCHHGMARPQVADGGTASSYGG